MGTANGKMGTNLATYNPNHSTPSQRGRAGGGSAVVWLFTLFAAESIPFALVTFVALLMFVQQGAGWSVATGLCALLSLPWVLKSFVREKVRQFGHFAIVLKAVEACMFAVLIGLAFAFDKYRYSVPQIFTCLFLLSCLCAWHELAARMYYERMLYPRWQRVYNSSKIFFSQTAQVITYGVLIMTVGALQVFYHNRSDAMSFAWNVAVYMLAGVFLLLVLYNSFVLRRPPVGNDSQAGTLAHAVRAEVQVIDRIAHKPRWIAVVLGLFVVLLPQSLMFHTRVLFLLASKADGGLGCTMLQVGFAQGTIGVMAFSIALGIGHRLLMHRGVRRTFWWFAIPLGLSPFVYWLMTAYPPANLLWLCIATFVAQFCFGLGLNLCVAFVRYISEERYRNTINYLYIPLVALVMIVPIALSGWLLQHLGFALFFAVDALCALPAWVVAATSYAFLSAYQVPSRNIQHTRKKQHVNKQ